MRRSAGRAAFATTALEEAGVPLFVRIVPAGGDDATRAIMADLRAGGDIIGGPAPFSKTDRSRFLQALDTALVRLSRT
jgi:hypothetical protein